MNRKLKELKAALDSRDDFLVQNDLWQSYIQFTLRANTVPKSSTIIKASDLWERLK